MRISKSSKASYLGQDGGIIWSRSRRSPRNSVAAKRGVTGAKDGDHHEGRHSGSPGSHSEDAPPVFSARLMAVHTALHALTDGQSPFDYPLHVRSVSFVIESGYTASFSPPPS